MELQPGFSCDRAKNGTKEFSAPDWHECSSSHLPGNFLKAPPFSKHYGGSGSIQILDSDWLTETEADFCLPEDLSPVCVAHVVLLFVSTSNPLRVSSNAAAQ